MRLPLPAMHRSVAAAALIAILLGVAAPTSAQTSFDSLEAQITEFLRARIDAPATDVRIRVTEPGVKLAPCRRPQLFMPSNRARLLGNVTVGVRCPDDRPAQRYYQANVAITSDYFVAARAIDAGTVLDPGDIEQRRGDLTRLPSNVATRAETLIGKASTRRIAAGQPLSDSVVRTPAAIERGQRVRVVAVGQGFSIVTEGKALNSAALGGQVRVRTDADRIVTGVSTDEQTVTIRP